MSRADELLDYLRRKGCAMQLNRIRADFRWPERELEALLDTLRKQQLITAPRPGEYQAAPPPLSEPERPYVPPAEAASSPAIADTVDRARLLGPAVDKGPRQPDPKPQPIRQPNPAAHEETTMPKGTKTCAKCKQTKGRTGFPKDSDVCRLCERGGAAKPQGGVAKKRAEATPRAVNGAGKSFKDLVNRHANGARFAGTVEELRALAAKATAAADALEALG